MDRLREDNSQIRTVVLGQRQVRKNVLSFFGMISRNALASGFRMILPPEPGADALRLIKTRHQDPPTNFSIISQPILPPE